MTDSGATDEPDSHRQITRRGFLGALVAGSGLAAAPITNAANQPSLPVDVETRFLGTQPDDEHSIRAEVTIAPGDEFGPIQQSTIRIRPTSHAFLGPRVETNERTGGDQVLTRTDERPLAFETSRLDPSETVSVTVYLYPKAEFPNDETLASVDIRAERAQNNEVVRGEIPITRAVAPADVTYGESPVIAPWLAGISGIGLGGLLVGAVAVWRRRLAERRLARELVTISDRATNTAVEELAEEALSLMRYIDEQRDTGTESSSGRDDYTGFGESEPDGGDTDSGSSSDTPIVALND